MRARPYGHTFCSSIARRSVPRLAARDPGPWRTRNSRANRGTRLRDERGPIAAARHPLDHQAVSRPGHPESPAPSQAPDLRVSSASQRGIRSNRARPAAVEHGTGDPPGEASKIIRRRQVRRGRCPTSRGRVLRTREARDGCPVGRSGHDRRPGSYRIAPSPPAGG